METPSWKIIVWKDIEEGKIYYTKTMLKKSLILLLYENIDRKLLYLFRIKPLRHV